MLQAIIAKYSGDQEVFVSGHKEQEQSILINQYHKQYRPFDVLIKVSSNEKSPPFEEWQEKSNNGKSFVAFICHDFTCEQPIDHVRRCIKVIAVTVV